ncbi:MAG: arginine--tRNA ligase [Clostridia bacterium]|nr:arginine--tRNA ligase [Clostridia bacterium]
MNEKMTVATLIANALGEQDGSNYVKFLETPPDRKMGDLAFPCFQLAKTLRKAPPMIAKEISEKIESAGELPELVEKIQVAGGYLNFFLNRAAVTKAVIGSVLTQGDDYGKSDEGAGKKVLVEFSSPNIAKPFHIGHLVSTALGSSLERIYKFLGYDTVKINHLGDWGTQFGKLISAYKRWGNEEAVRKDPINELLKIYVQFHKEAETQPELEDEARAYFKALEDGDEEVTRLWKFFVEASLTEFNRMYDMLGISFDSYAGESFYSDKMPEVVEIMRAKNILEESDGAQVVRFEDDNMPPCIILKSDGSTIYATRDIAAAVYRKRHYDFFKNIYVVGTPQALHFKQVFACLDKMGMDCAEGCVHVGFGYVRFPDRVLSTRHGDVVLLEDVLKEAVEKTKEIILQSATSKHVEDLDYVSEKIGVGAVLYAFLKNGRERDIIFTWKDMLDFEGESGPYVQYAYARGKSVLRKTAEMGIDYSGADLGLATSDEEYALVMLLNRFQNVVREAAEKYEPCVVTRYVTELAQQFNKFYNNCSIMKAEDNVRDARLKLTEAACICIRSALNLIGVEVVEKM